MTRALGVMTVLLAACATVRSPAARVAQDEAEAPRCESFAMFDARVQADSDELVAHAASDALVSGAAGLSRARRTCARHSIGTFIDRRETDGVEAVQTELDALARAFSAEELDGLLTEVLGPESAVLRPMLAEAVAHQAQPSARKTPPTTAASKEDLLPCAERAGACEAIACLIDGHAPSELISRRARACLDSLRPLSPSQRAEASSKLVVELRPLGTSGPLTEALLTLETLRRQLWPEVQATASAQPIIAARLAAPFAALDGSRDEVGRLRTRAIAFHLGLAREAAPHALAARLQRLVAAEAGGPAEPPLAGEPGHWSTPRWACTWPAPKLPAPFDDVELRLNASCRTLSTGRKSQPEPAGAMATFDLEKSLKQELVQGTLSATCAGHTFRTGFSVKAVILDASDTERAEAVESELQSLLAKAERECRSRRAEQAREDCETLPTMASSDAEQRYAEAFVATGKWEPCFIEHFTRRYGVPPPMPHTLAEP